jgi:HK97 family phage prohead protease
MKSRKLFFNNIKLRALETEGDKKVIEGVIPYNSRSSPIWGVTETIDPGAFKKTLADKKNVFALFNHDDGKILGSTRSGTLELEDAGDGLMCRCELPGASWGNDAWEIIRRGDGNTMSFGFSYPFKCRTSVDGKERTLLDVDLNEVSFCVPFAAYPETDSKILRGLKRMNIDIEKVNGILEKEQPDEDDIAVLQEFVNAVNSFIEKNKPEEEEGAEGGGSEEPPESGSRGAGASRAASEEEGKKKKEEIKREIIGLIDLLLETDSFFEDEDIETSIETSEE